MLEVLLHEIGLFAAQIKVLLPQNLSLYSSVSIIEEVK